MTQPTQSKAIGVLKRAIAEERREAKQRIQRYKVLTKKMNKYQQGTGPAPTSEDFDQWRADVETYVAIKLVQSGVSVVAPSVSVVVPSTASS
ncbi:MAG: hypothetical protein ABIR35_04705 [Polaromonas sp.]